MKLRNDCPSCGRERPSRLKKFHSVSLAKCGGCGFVFADMTPTGEELADHYAHKYANKYSPDAWVSPTTRKRLTELVATFEQFRTHGRLLDVGCGQGLLLEAAASQNWHPFGTEYSADAIEFGRSRGFEMWDGELLKDSYPADYFDVIVMTEVIEHMVEPGRDLSLVMNFVRPGGLLYLTTPNFDSLSRRVLGDRWNVIEYPAHLGYFSPSSLEHLCNRCGFDSELIETTGFSPTRFKKSLLGQEHSQIAPNDADELVRRALEGGRVASGVKIAVNRGLTLGRLGDGLKGYFIKRVD